MPDEIGFATKPQLAVDLIRRAVAGSVPFGWIAADEVYGRAGKLRAYVEPLGKGYVFTVPTSFIVTCADGARTVKTLAGRGAGRWLLAAFFYCHAPHGATLATLVRIAGRRWPVETCFRAAKSILGIDAHQVRLWHSWHRHTVLTLLAAALVLIRPSRSRAPRRSCPRGSG